MSKRDQPVEPASGRWYDAPRNGCDHDLVVLLTDVAGQPTSSEGRTALWCSNCEAAWREDLSNVKKS